jgi:hypothetical protein
MAVGGYYRLVPICPRLSAAIGRLATGYSHFNLRCFDYFLAVVGYDFK